MIEVPDFIDGADNVYRTKNYIVKQNLSLQFDDLEGNAVVSNDVFYVRNKRRDNAYEQIFADRKRIDGKRLPCSMHARKYVD